MKNLDAIYFAARELPSADRPEFLAQACAGDDELQQRVNQMLAVSAEAEAFITDLPDDESEDRTSDNGSAKNPKLDLADAPDEAVGQTLGRYKLLERVGEGGCGVVYVAEQTEPVRRRVALKVIKLGMDTKQVVARFEAERQALAMMDHPNIAKVLDAGTTEAGRPYFVMELVRGIRITDYCDQANLTTQERLDLFIKVCHAIQHAHQKGVIHRDIKPSNILVTLHDGVPVPRVIDFGIAKATEGRLTNATVYTQLHQFIGTPAYMSPEQAEMSGLDIDTRSDIYSLGVLLYELLAGSTPFDPKELMASGIDAMRKTIREKEPVRPSTKLSQTLVAADVRRLKSPASDTPSSEEEVRASSRRLLRVKETIALLQGDLDWIVMKCLEKDRTRRYETANGLAADLKRHLGNEPVVARPPSSLYRVQKFARRNRLAFGAGAAVIAALVVGLAVAAIGWRQTQVERDDARQARAGEEAQRRTAQANAVLAQEQRQQADRERQRAERGEAHAIGQLYAANINLAGQALEHAAFGRVRELLEETKKYPSRGFEWHYLQQQAHLNLKTFRGHLAAVSSVAYSPDGRRIVTGSFDGTVKVWEAASGQELLTLKGHTNAVLSVAFSPDGQRIVTGSFDGTAKVWEAASGQELLTLKGHSDRVWSVAFSPDGQRIVTGGSDTTAKVWEAASGQELLTLKGHSDWVPSVAFSPDGQRIITGSWDNTAKVWEAASGQELLTLKGHGGGVWSAAFSPDGQRIVTGSYDKTAKVWEAASGRELLTLKGHGKQVSSVAFSPDGQRIVTGSLDYTAKVWEAASGQEQLTLKGHGAWVRSVAFSPDGQQIVTGSNDSTAKVWEAASGNELPTLKGHGAEVTSAAFSPDGQRIVTGSWDKTAKVWEAASGKELLTLKGHGDKVISVAFSPDGQRIITGSNDSTAKVWEAASGKELLTLKGHSDLVASVAFSPDGQRIITGSYDKTAKVWETASGKELLTLKGHGEKVSSVAFSPDGQRIITGSDDSTAKVWEAASGRELLTLKGQGDEVRSVAFSPDGQRIVTGNGDSTAKVWEAASGKELLTLKGQGGVVNSVAFSPDGQRIVTGSLENTAKVWEAASGRELLALKGHGDTVWSVAFSPDGQRIVTGSSDKTAKVWEAATARQVAAWQAEEEADDQRLEAARAAAAEEEAMEQELSTLGETPGSAPKHKPSTQERPLVPGDPGEIRQWLVLAPLPFKGDPGVNTLRQQIPNEARLRPRAGERPPEAPTGLAWRAVRLSEASYKLDFQSPVNKAQPGSDTDNQLAYAVAYIVSELPQTGLMLLTGSDDTARIYLNEKEIYRQLKRRSFRPDVDEVSDVDLKAGLNVLVFKVANRTQGRAGSVRLLDAAGQSIKGVRVTLDPEGKK